MKNAPDTITEEAKSRLALQSHWPRLRRMTLQLLLAWFLITVLSIWFARELSGLVFFGWPLSFYLAAQGAVLCYLAVVGIYAWRADRLEARSQAEHGH
jgi:putative solute:sodium symporter small subunit